MKKKQRLPNLCSQLLVQDTYLHNYCIFEYSINRPTSASTKIHSRQSPSRPFHRSKLALILGKKSELTIKKIQILNFVQNRMSLTSLLKKKSNAFFLSDTIITSISRKRPVVVFLCVHFLSNDCPYICHPLELFLGQFSLKLALYRSSKKKNCFVYFFSLIYLLLPQEYKH